MKVLIKKQISIQQIKDTDDRNKFELLKENKFSLNQSKQIYSEGKLKDIYSLVENNNFIYHIIYISSENSFDNFHEIGIGKIEDSIFTRIKVIKTVFNGIEQRSEHFRKYIDSDYSDILLANYYPTSLEDLLLFPNCLIVSNTDGLSYIELSEDCLVARLDKEIQPINIRSLNKVESFSLAVIDSIKDYTKQLVLKSSKLTTKSVNVDYLSLNITDTKPPAKDGNIYFDKTSGTIRYYYDNNWNIILSKEI